MPWCRAASEPLDDDHWAAAAGAGVLGLLRVLPVVFGRCVGTRIDGFNSIDRNYRRRGEQQFAGTRDVLLTLAAREHPVITDAVEASGQHVHQEPADELVCVE